MPQSHKSFPIPILAPIDPSLIAPRPLLGIARSTATADASWTSSPEMNVAHNKRENPFEREEKRERRVLSHTGRFLTGYVSASSSSSSDSDADSDYAEEKSSSTSESDSESSAAPEEEEEIDLTQNSIFAPAAATATASAAFSSSNVPSNISPPTTSESQYKHPMFYRMSLRSLSQAQWLEAIVRLPILRQDAQLRQFLPVLEMAIEYLQTHEITTHFSRQRRQSTENRQLQLERKRQKKNNGRGLEMYAAMLFRLRGYDRTEHLGGPHDGGIDVLAFRRTPSAVSSTVSISASDNEEVATIQCGELRKLFDMDKVRAFHSTMTSKQTIQCKRKSRATSSVSRYILPISAVRHAYLITSSTFPIQARQAIDEINLTRMQQNHLNEQILEGMKELQFLAATKLCSLCQTKRDKLLEQCEHRLMQQRHKQRQNRRELLDQSTSASPSMITSHDDDLAVSVGSDDLIRQFERKLRSEFCGQFHLVDGKVLLEWIHEIEARTAEGGISVDNESNSSQLRPDRNLFLIERAEVQMAIDSIKRLMMPMWHFFNPQFRSRQKRRSSTSTATHRPQKMNAEHKREIQAAWPWQSQPVWDGQYHRGGDLAVALPARRGSALGLPEDLQRRILEASELEDSVARVAASKAAAVAANPSTSAGTKRKSASEMKRERKQKQIELEAAAFRANILMEALKEKGIRLPTIGSTPVSIARYSATAGAIDTDPVGDEPSQKRQKK